jgi:hypothetical protein
MPRLSLASGDVFEPVPRCSLDDADMLTTSLTRKVGLSDDGEDTHDDEDDAGHGLTAQSINLPSRSSSTMQTFVCERRTSFPG